MLINTNYFRQDSFFSLSLSSHTFFVANNKHAISPFPRIHITIKRLQSGAGGDANKLGTQCFEQEKWHVEDATLPFNNLITEVAIH